MVHSWYESSEDYCCGTHRDMPDSVLEALVVDGIAFGRTTRQLDNNLLANLSGYPGIFLLWTSGASFKEIGDMLYV